MNDPDHSTADGARPDPVGEMHKRQIAMPDGRYMIFYTFGDEELGTNPSETAKAGETDADV